nr:VCBS repeat-containing protein [Candidatus Gracilibacteria bacterium]
MKQILKKFFSKKKNPLKFIKIEDFISVFVGPRNDYSLSQKIISFILISFLLFNIGLRVPFIEFFNYKVNAENKEFYNLVSIIVDDNIYGDVKSKLSRYARDIEGVLDNTKVVIIPTPHNASSFQIASLNESLYFEGYKSVKNVNFESKLIGSLFVGNIPLPIVKNGENYSKTILPYIDFENKTYVYNHKNDNYEKAENGSSTINPEIWQGVIAPNTGNKDDDIQAIKDYFDKNHDYYTGAGLFNKNLGVINGNKNDGIPDDYEPYVFYFDQYREEQAINYTNYKGYEARQSNLEDIVYNRFSKELATKLKDQILNGGQDELQNLIKTAFPELALSGTTSSGSMFDGTSDISTRYVTNQLTKRFIEIFNSSTLAEMRQNVFNAGRYSQTYDKVNADLVPFLVSVIDLISEEVIKNANDDLENTIDNVVKNGLSRKIPIFESYKTTNMCGRTYTNYFYGKKASTLTGATDCSIYRGSLTNSGTLVEANRGYNINNIQADSTVISQCSKSSFSICGADMSCLTRGWWGGNSPINLDTKSSNGGVTLNLGTHVLSGSITPLFDIGGAKKENDINKTNSPLDCFKGVGILTEQYGLVWETCSKTYSIDQKIGWNCSTNNLAKGTVNYNDFYKTYNNLTSKMCWRTSVSLDGKVVKQKFGLSFGECEIITENYFYKTIPSYIFHKSPNQDDLKTQVNSMVTPALPIDKDRYVDFIGADGNYKKINYPYLYRINISTGSGDTFENIDKLLQASLNTKTSEINNLISTSKPNPNDTIYNNYLKTGTYPDANLDLLKSLKDKPLKTYNLDGDQKQVSYYDSLVFSLYWKNLNSVSAKYKFIFENYLSDQFNGNTYKFGLPKNKKMYEISYMGAPGDAENMYIKIDPESKNANPYADIMAKNATLNNLLLGLNAGNLVDQSKLFKCGPPDGVPIWQWIPAIMCRLKTMLPPTIKIGGGNCSNKSLFLTEEEQKKYEACDGDINKNGINDCLESELGGGSLEFTSDSSRYYYNKFGRLNLKLLDKDGNQLKYDNSTVVNFELEKLESLDNGLIYEKGVSNENGRKDADNYFSFKDGYQKVSSGEADYAFASKTKDVDAYIRAYINIVDYNKQSQIKLEKTIKIEVRGDNFFASTYNLNNDNNVLNVDSGTNGVLASDNSNIYLVDGYNNTIDGVKNNINNSSTSKEKLVFVLENYSKLGSKLPINYPIKYNLYKGDDIFSTGTLNSLLYINFGALSGALDYNLVVEDKYGFKFSKKFTVKPEKANSAEITLGTSILETGNVVTTHFLTIYDKFKNPVSGEFYNIEGSISGDGLLFDENSKKNITFQTIEGYKAFRLKSTDNEGNNTISFKIKDVSGTEITNVTKNVKTIKDVVLGVAPLQSSIKVGGGEYGFNFSVRDKDGNIINDFNSRLYLTLNSIYGIPKDSYVDVKNGVGTVKFITKRTAAKDVKLSFQIEGLKKIYTKYIDILPDDPIRIDLSLSRDKIEASPKDYTILKAELKDRFGNLVYNNNSVNLSLEVKDQYKNIITPEINSSIVSSGVATFKINATDIPGLAYIMVRASPEFKTILEIEGQAPFIKSSLHIVGFTDSNGLTETGKKFFEEYNLDYYRSKFSTLNDLKNSPDFDKLTNTQKNDLIALWLKTNKITINPQSENAIKLETFYFWNKEAIDGNYYNGLYTVLLGAPYGDITKQDYLAGALLFDKNNRSLAVTSLLNDPYKHNDVISISGNGAISSIKDSQNITQDIKYISNIDKNGKLYFDIYNDALSIYVGKVYYNLDTNNEIKICTGNNLDFSDCNISKTKTSISLKNIGNKYSAYEESGTLVLKDSLGNIVFRINKDGTISKNAVLSLENYSLNDSKNAVFSIKDGNTIVALFSYNLINSTLNVTRDESLLSQKLSTLKNSIIVYLNTYLYGNRTLNTNENEVLMIYYNDPFADNTTLDAFSEADNSSIENFKDNKGVGWSGKNKSLLLFAAGESVGESTKKYSSFSLINLGDPVINLKNIKKKLPGTNVDRSFDSTVGKLISKDSKNVGYKILDYNNDKLDDLILIKSNSYIQLLENRGNLNFDNKGNLVYIPELGSKPSIESGDFTGDGYGDIFYVAKGKPYLLNNVEKKFIKMPLENQFNLNGSIVRTSSFDMDNDGKKDIVTLDTSGEINIFYGGGTSTSPVFTKKKVGDGYLMKLDSQVKDGNGAVYYAGLPTLNNDQTLNNMILSNEDLIKAIQSAGTGSNNSFDIDQRLIDNILFVKLPYSTGSLNVIGSDATIFTGGTVDSFNIPVPNSNELGTFNTDTINGLKDLSNYSSNNIYYYPTDSNNSQNTTFVKSEYSNSFGIKVEKVFTDINGGSLNSGDIVNIEVKLKNTSNSTKKNIAYAENIEDYFYFNNAGNNVQTSKESNIRYNIGNYDFVVDNFSLNPGEELSLEYQVETLPLTYGYLETGLFEKGEAGDDVCGDIMLKPDDKSCSLNVDLYRSVGSGNNCSRSYDKGQVQTSCNLDKLQLPGSLELNKIDENGNGVPDYIDNLATSAVSKDKTDIQNYSSGALNDILKDTDGDGIPDDEDPTPGYNNNNQDTGNFLDTINNTTDQILDGLDFISQGLCKGFGGGSCVSSPLNAAPLAPGSSLTLFGFPISPAYPSQYGVVGSGLPIFSALTGLQTSCGTSPCCIPVVWPISSSAYVPGPACGPSSAGGILGTWAPTNVFRLFVTPTITGAVGTAACFGGPAMTAGYAPFFPGLYPFLTLGGNCVVAAKPLVGCKGDGSDGDPKQKNTSVNFGNYDVLNGSCVNSSSSNNQSYFRFDSQFVSNYLKYKNGDQSKSVIDAIKSSFNSIANNTSQITNMPANPLITIGEGNQAGAGSFSIDIDTKALKNGNLKDVVKIQNTWITDFPAFLMDWVDRQIEEIVTKLTSFPSIIVILPDFSGVFDDSWNNFFDNVKSSFEYGKQKGTLEDQKVQSELDTVNSAQESKQCADKSPSDEGYFDCLVLNLKSQNLGLQKDYKPSQTISGIKSVYEFIGNLPLISIQEQTVNVNVPWITETSLLKAKVNFEMTKKQWQDEIERAKEAWSLGQLCNQSDPVEKANCEKKNEAGNKIILQANALINSLDKDTEVIEGYKKFPEKLVGLLNKKEERLQQVLCNIDTIVSLFGGWLGTNGERFKAWVQAYILIKAVLKSWQLLVDVFNDYEVSCKQCKNERQDLMTFMWKLISMVVPKIPVIQFPKWPNIILDLHNIKAGLIIALPDFKFNVRPIVIPTLPKLYLPLVPDINIVLPTIPILDSLELPTLPDLPTLPKIELPDLPPPPKLPKLLGSIEGVLNILKIITKVQCILKSSPLVPEWRAGDQIAYISERQGFLPFDFIDVSLPQFSFPFVDAIKITTYVNFEMETDFVTEMARQSVAPINTFTNNIINLFRTTVPNLDFSSPLQERIDVNLGNKTGMNENKKTDKEIVEGELNNFSKFIAYSMFKVLKFMKDNRNIELSNKDFLTYVNENLASKALQADPETENIRKLWQDVSNMTYSNEDKLINDLKDKNKEKFDALKDIINTEIQRTKTQKESIKNLNKPNSIKFVSSTNDSNVKAYNEILRKHNLETVKATMNLLTDNNNDTSELKKDGDSLLTRVKSGLNDFTKSLAANTSNSSSGVTSASSTCSSDPNYKFDYKGIYVIENGISYRLFDYIDELKGNEKLGHTDFDNDDDEDLLYMVNGELYLKENTKNTVINNPTIYDPYELSIGDNKFFNSQIFYEAINNPREVSSANGYINFSFDAPTNDTLNNFRLEFYDIVDKFLNENYNSYVPQNIRKEIIDSFADIDNIPDNRYTLDYNIKNNLAYLSAVGNNINDDFVFEGKEMINIKDDISNNKVVSLSSNTKLYAGKTPFTITYYINSSSSLYEVTVNRFENIQFKSGAKITAITGNAYIQGQNTISLKGQSIKDYVGLPILPGVMITSNNDNLGLLSEASHIDINYYDGTVTNLDFRDIKSYRIYDLGFKSNSYLISTKQKNDFYYSRINAFKENINGTKSSQVLLSPQLSSDNNAPEINLSGNIKIPVYQKYTYDFTPYIYEDSGLIGIDDFYIDTDLDVDSDNDGDKTNDRDIDNGLVKKTFNSVKVDFGPYNELFTKKIGLHIKDLAGNSLYKEAILEVYSPIPSIDAKNGDNVIGSINEKLSNEPINLYRYRGGVLSKLIDKSNNQKVNTTSSGTYLFDVNLNGNDGLLLYKNGIVVATINENTGNITIKNLPGAKIDVLPSTNTNPYVKIILSSGVDEIYYEYFSFDKVQNVSIVEDLVNTSTDGIYLRLDNKSIYSYYQVPLSVPYNPGAIVIYSIDDPYKTPLFTIFSDGRISTYSNYYSLEYNTIGDNVSIKLFDNNRSKQVGEVLMKMSNGNYIMK